MLVRSVPPPGERCGRHGDSPVHLGPGQAGEGPDGRRAAVWRGCWISQPQQCNLHRFRQRSFWMKKLKGVLAGKGPTLSLLQLDGTPASELLDVGPLAGSEANTG